MTSILDIFKKNKEGKTDLAPMTLNRHARRTMRAQAIHRKEWDRVARVKFALEMSKKDHREHVERQQAAAHERAFARRQEAEQYGAAYPRILAERAANNALARRKAAEQRIAKNRAKRAEYIRTQRAKNGILTPVA